MIQYLLNATTIWILGLIAFDVFLRRESYHGYNRLYLLTLLLAGIFIPLWSWDYDSVVYTTGFSEPIIEQSALIKETVSTGTPVFLLNTADVLWLIYLAGVFVSTVLLARELIIIVKLYQKGSRSGHSTWTIVETGKPISPFSAFRYIFISSKGNYSAEELQMILAHEEQHGHLLHFIDLLLFRIAAIVFWFHPLVYLLEKRILMVHEYQADRVTDNPGMYGRFLVEQSVLGPAPALSHSFIRSPLQKRILMLTKRSSAFAKGKQFIILPLLLVFVLCFTNNAFSGGDPQKDGNKVTYRGNVIEFSEEGTPDTTIVVDPLTGEHTMRITRRSAIPIKLNGEKIYLDYELNNTHEPGTPYKQYSKTNLTSQTLKEYLLSNMHREIKRLEEGSYSISLGNIIVNKAGEIVYFEFGGIIKSGKGNERSTRIDEKTEEKIARKIASLINNAPKHQPAVYNGEKVHSILQAGGIYSLFTIKDGKLESL